MQEGIYEAFVAKMAERIRALRVGDGLDSRTNMGPLINVAARDKVGSTCVSDKKHEVCVRGDKHDRSPPWQGTDVCGKSSACFVFVHGREAWCRPDLFMGWFRLVVAERRTPDAQRSRLISWNSFCCPWDPLLVLVEEEMLRQQWKTAHLAAVLNHRR